MTFMNLLSSLKHICITFFLVVFTANLTAQNPVKEGQWYAIEIYDGSKVLSVNPNATQNGVPITLDYASGQNHQLFRFEAVEDGFYVIRSKSNNKVLDIAGGSRDDAALLQQWDWANVENQKFKLVLATGEGHYYIMAKHSKKYLKTAIRTDYGTTISQTQNPAVTNRMFKFTPKTPTQEKPIPVVQPVTNVKPAKVELITPVPGQVINNVVGTSIQFNWKEVPNATQYQIYVDHKDQKSQLLNTLTNASNYQFTLSTLIPEAKVKDAWGWWVRAKNGDTWGDWSNPNTLYFHNTPNVTVNTAPQLYSPASNAVLSNGNIYNNKEYTWVFDWSDVPNAQRYEISVTHPKDPAQSWIQTVTQSTYQKDQTYHVPYDYLNGWNWRVRAIVNGNFGPWSSPQYFNVAQITTQVDPATQNSSNFVTTSKENFLRVSDQGYAAKLFNKVNNRSTALGYDVQAKNFAANAGNQNWRLKKLRTNTYLLQVEINGKFWSLSAPDDLTLKLTNSNVSDSHQQWTITSESDGYYRITNAGLAAENNKFNTLFYDSTKNNLFLTTWVDAKSLNARWFFEAGQKITIPNDPLENRTLRMYSDASRQTICLDYVMTSDATGYTILTPCANGTTTNFQFVKTVQGNYLIKIQSTGIASRDWFYLTDDLKIKNIDPYIEMALNPEYGLTWKLVHKGGNKYSIISAENGKAFELVKPSFGSSRELVDLKSPSYSANQLWLLY